MITTRAPDGANKHSSILHNCFEVKNMFKTPENRFFLTENWHVWVLNLRNYQNKKGPGLATD